MKNPIFHMLQYQVPKRKRRVCFPFRKQSVRAFVRLKLQPSQQTCVSGVSFPKQVPPTPLNHLTLFISTYPPFLRWPAALASSPQGAVAVRTHAGWKNRPATFKESACL